MCFFIEIVNMKFSDHMDKMNYESFKQLCKTKFLLELYGEYFDFLV